MKIQWNLGDFEKDLETAFNKELSKVADLDESKVTRALQRATKTVFGEPMKLSEAKKLAKQLIASAQKS